MAIPAGHVKVPGSERTHVERARVIGPIDPNERITVSVIVRPRPAGQTGNVAAEFGVKSVRQRRYLRRGDEFAAARGADPADLAKVAAFAQQHGLTVEEANGNQRTVKLAGTLADATAAFGANLQLCQHPDGSIYRGRTGPLYVPTDLDGVVIAVQGLDNRPQARPHVRWLEPTQGAVQPNIAGDVPFTAPQLAQLYNFPPGLSGSGQTIGIIELGGGYSDGDLQSYFQSLGLAVPQISAVSVDGAANTPGVDQNTDVEVLLDVEVAGAVAPGAKIAVYFAPNTDQGFLDAITSAIHDTANQPSVISISWGNAEALWTRQSMLAMDQAFQDAASLGVSICVAAGDGGSQDRMTDNLLHADFPASSPFTLACGGTHLDASNGTISSEVVWNDGPNGGSTGGGISDVFDPPSYQSDANVPPSANPGGRIGRGVPDVAGDASPSTGYEVLVDGQQLVVGGTSAVAPLWAGLIALLNQGLGSPVGFLNPPLYAAAPNSAVLHRITSGNNDITGNGGPYQAGPSWNACTGWGAPNGANLLQVL